MEGFGTPRTRASRGWSAPAPPAGRRSGAGVSVGTVNGRLVARRAGIVALCVLSLVACVGLAWWQWQRFESTSGTWQNLGYVLQWPLFGLFPAFMFWRLRTLRARQREVPEPAESAPKLTPKPAAEAASTAEAAPTAPPAARVEDDDPELAAYNRYLAELNARHQERQR